MKRKKRDRHGTQRRSKLLNWVFTWYPKEYPKAKHLTGVNAYSIAEAREYFRQYLAKQDLTLTCPVESIEPEIYDDTDGMKPGF